MRMRDGRAVEVGHLPRDQAIEPASTASACSMLRSRPAVRHHARLVMHVAQRHRRGGRTGGRRRHIRHHRRRVEMGIAAVWRRRAARLAGTGCAARPAATDPGRATRPPVTPPPPLPPETAPLAPPAPPRGGTAARTARSPAGRRRRLGRVSLRFRWAGGKRSCGGWDRAPGRAAAGAAPTAGSGEKPPARDTRPSSLLRQNEMAQIDLGTDALPDQPAIDLVIGLMDERRELLVQHRLQNPPGLGAEAGGEPALRHRTGQRVRAQHIQRVEFVAVIERRHPVAQIREPPAGLVQRAIAMCETTISWSTEASSTIASSSARVALRPHPAEQPDDRLPPAEAAARRRWPSGRTAAAGPPADRGRPRDVPTACGPARRCGHAPARSACRPPGASTAGAARKSRRACAASSGEGLRQPWERWGGRNRPSESGK